MCACISLDASVTLYHIHNRALLAYDTFLHKKDKEAEQYHTTIPEYWAPDISYKKKSVDVSKISSKRTENAEIHLLNKKMSEMWLLMIFSPCHFLCWKQLVFMETGKTFYIPSTQPVVNNQWTFQYHWYRICFFILT